MNEYEKLHAVNPGYGRTGVRLGAWVQPLIDDIDAQTILDYGCGKGLLGKKLQADGNRVSFF